MQPMFEYVNLCRNNKGHMLSMSTILVAEKFWYSSFLNIPFYMPIFVLSGQELHLKIELEAPSKNHKENRLYKKNRIKHKDENRTKPRLSFSECSFVHRKVNNLLNLLIFTFVFLNFFTYFCS